MNPESPYATPVNTPSVMTVTALNQAVAQLLERNLPLTWVSGEISNFTRATSGHWYFTLKDSGAQVRAVMFRGRAQYADFQPKEGDKVEVRALVTLYAPRGDYQLSVEAIRRAGVGNQYEAFLRLKAQLTQEGLFDAERKRPLPVFVKTIGIVTSPQAAALRDILIALRRRTPHVNIILYPTPVQGEGAGMKIAQAIASAAAREECDVLLVCRGGGSMEDLWAFNEEVVARTIVNCPMPVIAGIGHETDFTIADFAADLRAATPTAAAELAATPRDAWLQLLQRQSQILSRCMHRQLDDQAQTLDWQSRRLQSPRAAIVARRLQLANLARNLSQSASLPVRQARHELTQLTLSWQTHRPDLSKPRLLLADMQRRLQQAARHVREGQQQQLSSLRSQLELLNPQRTLERGYAILSDHKGKALRKTSEIKPQSLIQVRLASGTAEVGISSVQTKLV